MCIGVGGADAVDVMAGLPWELKCPHVIPYPCNQLAISSTVCVHYAGDRCSSDRGNGRVDCCKRRHSEGGRHTDSGWGNWSHHRVPRTWG